MAKVNLILICAIATFVLIYDNHKLIAAEKLKRKINFNLNNVKQVESEIILGRSPFTSEETLSPKIALRDSFSNGKLSVLESSSFVEIMSLFLKQFSIPLL